MTESWRPFRRRPCSRGKQLNSPIFAHSTRPNQVFLAQIRGKQGTTPAWGSRKSASKYLLPCGLVAGSAGLTSYEALIMRCISQNVHIRRGNSMVQPTMGKNGHRFSNPSVCVLLPGYVAPISYNMSSA